jgi:hypothetical protein
MQEAHNSFSWPHRDADNMQDEPKTAVQSEAGTYAHVGGDDRSRRR